VELGLSVAQGLGGSAAEGGHVGEHAGGDGERVAVTLHELGQGEEGVADTGGGGVRR
jgi:hypothetical protein